MTRAFATALMLLTRLPAGWLLRGNPPADLSQCWWAFMPIGALVGLIGGLAYRAAGAAGLPTLLAALLAVAIQVLVCGALHEDGLADFFDGLGGATVERRLAIMRDSRIGTYGTLALLLVMQARIMAIASIRPSELVLPALIAAGAGGRAAMVIVILCLKPARPDGLASGLAAARLTAAGAIVSLVLLSGLLLLPGRIAPITVLGTAVTPLVMGWHFRRRLGGYTGDTLGALEAIAETVILILVSGWHPAS